MTAGWRRRLAAALGTGPRTTGFPTSSNRASSFHLPWLGLEGEHVVSASVTLEIVEPPTVARLYFWAMQVTFTGPGGRGFGGAHLGLQWHPAHPGGTAVNWGGYAPGGGELAGGPSALPSATGNVNTRDFAWRPGTPYRLLVAPAPEGGWRGSVVPPGTDPVPVRDLAAGGDHLTGLMVWSEVFARCDDPPAAVRWSDPAVVLADGREVSPRALRVNYQTRADGGCDNTDVAAAPGGAVQRTGVPRTVPAGSVLDL